MGCSPLEVKELLEMGHLVVGTVYTSALHTSYFHIFSTSSSPGQGELAVHLTSGSGH